MADRKARSSPELHAVLEEIDSGGRLAREVVEANRVILEHRIQALATDLGRRLTRIEKVLLTSARRANGSD